MDDGGPTASIILFVLLLLIDCFFFGFGSAIRNLNVKEIGKKAAEHDKKAIRLLKMMEKPAAFVNTLQLTVTLIHIIMGSFYLSLCLRQIKAFLKLRASGVLEGGLLHGLSLLCAGAALIFVILTFGVQIPKKVAAKYPEKWAFACVTPVYFIMALLVPFTGFVTLTAGAVLRLLGIRQDLDQSDVTEEEIISMVNEGHEQGVLQASEAEMITNIFEFGDKEAKDIMTHRKNITAIDGRLPLREAVGLMLAGKNSRYPVYEENIDHITGILHMKDALRMLASDGNLNAPVMEIEGLVREAKFIPETRNIDSLFKSMQSQKIQMVIVVDEYGQTGGLIAMEDILEEIVGNIQDEYDEDLSYIEQKGDGQYEMDGMTPLEELEERFSISFEEEEFDTLNGFLISRMDKIPEADDEQFEVNYAGYSFRVLSVENKMIRSVLVTKLPEETEPEAGAETDDNK